MKWLAEVIRDGTGKPLIDEEGNPVLDGNGDPILDGTGEVIERKPLYRTDAKHKPKGKEIIIIEGVKTSFPVIEEGENETFTVGEDLTAKGLDDKSKAVDVAVITEASKVFKNKNLNNIFTRLISYTLRVIAPEKYLTEGLTASRDIGAFTTGEALDTVEKIKDFYLELLVYLDKFRLNEIKKAKE